MAEIISTYQLTSWNINVTYKVEFNNKWQNLNNKITNFTGFSSNFISIFPVDSAINIGLLIFYYNITIFYNWTFYFLINSSKIWRNVDYDVLCLLLISTSIIIKSGLYFSRVILSLALEHMKARIHKQIMRVTKPN